MTTYTVHSYDTGLALQGTPLRSLVRRSLAEGDTGAVYAYHEPSDDTWRYVHAPHVDHYRRFLRLDVCRVYVMEAP